MAVKRRSNCSPAEILEFVRLYEKYGSYSAVGLAVDRSPSTVSKHIKIYYASKMGENAAAEVEPQARQIIINL